MSATVLLTCDLCGVTLSTLANANGSNPATAARAAARETRRWMYAGTVGLRRDYCRECWESESDA